MASSWTDKHTWGLVGAVLGLLSFVPYAVALRRGTAKPHCFSWLVWSLISGIAFVAQVLDSAGPGAWYLGVTTSAYLGVALFALTRGDKDISPTDWLALGAALAAIPLWVLTADATLAVVLVSAIDVAAFFPTVRKSIAHPHDEPIAAYALGAVGLIASIVGLETRSLDTTLSPTTLAVTDVAFVVVLVLRRRALARGVGPRSTDVLGAERWAPPRRTTPIQSSSG